MAIPSFGPLGIPVEPDRLRELVRQAKAGDAVSFDLLVGLEERRVLRLAQRLLLNREAARDAAQDVFLRFYRKLGSIQENKNWEAWLYRTTVNICFDALRRAKADWPLDLAEDQFATDLDPEQSAANREQNRRVLEALQRLSPRERSVIVLRELEGHSTAEVAAILGSSEATVRSQIFSAKAKLRALLPWGKEGRK